MTVQGQGEHWCLHSMQRCGCTCLRTVLQLRTSAFTLDFDALEMGIPDDIALKDGIAMRLHHDNMM